MPRPKGSRGHTDLEELFLKKCEPTPCKFPALGECWIWSGAVFAPRFEGDPLRGQMKGATWGTRYPHQWACHHWNDSPLPVEKGKCVKHKCDTPLCVNPAHLDYGTWEENFQEMYDRNPTALGRQPPTDEQLALIRRLKDEGASLYRMCKELNKSATWLRRIFRDYFPTTP